MCSVHSIARTQTNLQSFVTDENFSDNALKYFFPHFGNLKQMSLLRCNSISASDGFPLFLQLTFLNSLTLVSSGISESQGNSLKFLSELSNLTELRLRKFKQVGDGLGKFVENLAQLKFLEFSDFPKVSDKILMHLTNLTQLCELKVDKCTNITEKGVNGKYSIFLSLRTKLCLNPFCVLLPSFPFSFSL